MKRSFLVMLAGAALCAAACTPSAAGGNEAMAAAPKAAGTIYDFTMRNIDGKEVNLADYKGKVLLIVNTATYCGNTPQYGPLEKLYEAKKDQGLVVLGFPANQFGGQEPGTDRQIKTFCTGNYHVSFPMFSKIVVKGDGINPLYSWLIANAPYHDDVEWNFAKFLIGRDGTVVDRFNPRVKPDDPTVVAAIDKALAASH